MRYRKKDVDLAKRKKYFERKEMALTKKTLHQLVARITRALQSELFRRDDTTKISVSPEHGDNIHILIVSNLFNGLTFPERDNIVWPVLENALEDCEIVHISLCLLLTPDEALVGA